MTVYDVVSSDVVSGDQSIIGHAQHVGVVLQIVSKLAEIRNMEGVVPGAEKPAGDRSVLRQEFIQIQNSIGDDDPCGILRVGQAFRSFCPG